MNRGSVDDDVQAPKTFDRAANDRVHFGKTCYIAVFELDGLPEFCRVASPLLIPGLVNAAGNHLGAFGGKARANGSADSCGTGHERHPSGKLFHRNWIL